eukprot:9147623-Karenia_brevis.AAC.1
MPPPDDRRATIDGDESTRTLSGKAVVQGIFQRNQYWGHLMLRALIKPPSFDGWASSWHLPHPRQE